MKKLTLGLLFSLTLILGIAFIAPAARADTQPTGSTVQTTTGTTTAAAAAAAANKPTVYSSGMGLGGYVMVPIMRLGAWLLGMAAITLDTTVYYTVVHMGSIVGGTDGLSAIGVAWRALRDIGNILLIFGFVALGITVILQVNWYGGGTSMLPKLLLAAVFLNFSLFISEATIDVGNLFATQFYTQINGGVAPGPLSSSGSLGEEGISNKIMAQLGLQSIYGAALDTNKDILTEGNVWLIGTFGTILFLIAAFVFYSLAFILIARFVILTLLIIVAPIGFAGLAVPRLSGFASSWWKKLFEQVITAPVLLLLLYIALAVITDARFLTNFGGVTSDSQVGWLGFIGSSGSFDLGTAAGMLLSFFVAMGMLLAVTFAAKSMSAFGAGQATKFGGALSFGALAYGASLPVNLASNASRRALQRYAPSNTATRLIASGLRRGENFRADVRRLPGFEAGLKAGGGAEATAPIGKSTLGRVRQGKDWWDKTGKTSAEAWNKETVMRRLNDAVKSGDRAETSKIMRGLSDDQFKEKTVQDLITSEPLAVKVLTNAQAAKLSDKSLTTQNVYENLSINQLEAVRHAGNVAPQDQNMADHLAQNQYDAVYLAGRNGGDQAAIKAFWHI